MGVCYIYIHVVGNFQGKLSRFMWFEIHPIKYVFSMKIWACHTHLHDWLKLSPQNAHFLLICKSFLPQNKPFPATQQIILYLHPFCWALEPSRESLISSILLFITLSNSLIFTCLKWHMSSTLTNPFLLSAPIIVCIFSRSSPTPPRKSLNATFSFLFLFFFTATTCGGHFPNDGIMTHLSSGQSPSSITVYPVLLRWRTPCSWLLLHPLILPPTAAPVDDENF